MTDALDMFYACFGHCQDLVSWRAIRDMQIFYRITPNGRERLWV